MQTHTHMHTDVHGQKTKKPDACLVLKPTIQYSNLFSLKHTLVVFLLKFNQFKLDSEVCICYCVSINDESLLIFV